jgi:hypothetical protein
MGNLSAQIIPAKATQRHLGESVGEEVSAAHSLHLLAPFREIMRPHFAAHFIEKLSLPGETVCDPFCGSGLVGLEAYFSRRIPVLSDSDPLAIAITEAKLQPADITELTLALHSLNLNRPVSLELYQKGFSSFYDIDTFREISTIRQALLGVTSRASVYCRGIAAGLLHGHTAGYLSVYTFPHLSLTPAEQERLSSARGATPSYRAVVPRIIRKAALLARDCTPSMFSRQTAANIAVSDPRNLSHLATGSVDLLLTAPPVPEEQGWRRQQWLRRWFYGLSEQNFFRECESLQKWEVYIDELKDEFARVTRIAGHVVLVIREEASRKTQLYQTKIIESFCRGNALGNTSWSHVSTLTLLSKQKKMGHNGTSTVLKPVVVGRAIVLKRKS